MVQPERPQMTILRIHIVRWITNATNTSSEYIIVIDVSQQQRLRERASMLGYM
jgi:hypothetical protein